MAPISSRNSSVNTETEAAISPRLDFRRVPERVFWALYPSLSADSTLKGDSSKTSSSSVLSDCPIAGVVAAKTAKAAQVNEHGFILLCIFICW